MHFKVRVNHMHESYNVLNKSDQKMEIYSFLTIIWWCFEILTSQYSPNILLRWNKHIENHLECMLCITMRYRLNLSAMVNSKKIQILYYCLTLHYMIQQSIWFARAVCFKGYWYCYKIYNLHINAYRKHGSEGQWITRLTRKQNVVRSNRTFSFCNSRLIHVPHHLTKPTQM